MTTRVRAATQAPMSSAEVTQALGGQLSQRHVRRLMVGEMGGRSRGRRKKLLLSRDAFVAWKEKHGLN